MPMRAEIRAALEISRMPPGLNARNRSTWPAGIRSARKPSREKEDSNTVIGTKVACENCGNEFEKKREKHRFCSKACRYAVWDRNHPRMGIEKTSQRSLDTPKV